MATKIELDVEITPEGEVRIKTHGLKGTRCVDELNSFEKSLGPARDVKKTSEFYESAANQQKDKQNSGRKG